MGERPARLFSCLPFFSFFYSTPGNEGQLEGVVPNNREVEAAETYTGRSTAYDFVKGEWTHPTTERWANERASRADIEAPITRLGRKLFIRGLRLLRAAAE